MLIPSKHSGYQAGIRLYPGGKGGSSAPPPDPALIQAQIKSMGIQDSAIQQILDSSNELLPLQKQQLQFGLDSAKTAYDQSQQDRSYMLARRGVLTQMQDQQVADAKSFNTEARQNELAAQAGADAEQAFTAAQAGTARNLARMGVTPDSGKALAMDNENGIAKAAAIAGARVKTRAQGRMEGYSLTDRAANGLAGYPSMSMQATGNGAGYGTSGITVANAGLAGMNSGFTTASQIAGSMGTNASNMYGVQANAAAADQNNRSQGFGALLGAGATIGSAFIL